MAERSEHITKGDSLILEAIWKERDELDKVHRERKGKVDRRIELTLSGLGLAAVVAGNFLNSGYNPSIPVYSIISISGFIAVSSFIGMTYYFYKLSKTTSIEMLDLGSEQWGSTDSVADTEDGYKAMIRDFRKENVNVLESQKETNDKLANQFNKGTKLMYIYFVSLLITLTIIILFQFGVNL